MDPSSEPALGVTSAPGVPGPLLRWALHPKAMGGGSGHARLFVAHCHQIVPGLAYHNQFLQATSRAGVCGALAREAADPAAPAKVGATRPRSLFGRPSVKMFVRTFRVGLRPVNGAVLMLGRGVNRVQLERLLARIPHVMTGA